MIRWSPLAMSVVALAGCFAAKPLEVRVTNDAYQVGEIRTALATPAVDEVVRMKPSKVLLVACTTTQPTKIMQFQQELQARHQVKLQLLILQDAACPA